MEETQQQQGLRRSLKARHMNMIAIGGAIGTGLFVAGGETVSSAGPGGALVAYALIGIMVYFLMTGLGEMASYLPVSGSFEMAVEDPKAGAFSYYATQYWSKRAGFISGWNYWFNWAITVAAELVAGALIMKYWFPDVPAAIWSGLFLIILFVLNYLSTRSYGESEFIFAGIKVLTVLVFLFAGTLLILGLGPEPSPGFTNWTIGDAPFVGGFTAMLGIFMVAGFSFQGTEMIGIAAGESEDPEKNVPRAVHSIFWRILIFYIGSIFIILCIYPWNEVSYIGSPFVMTFAKVGISAAAGIINFVVLTAALSGCNSGMYSSGRMLYTLAQNGQAPKIFAKLSPTGVPRNSIAVTIVVLAIGVILNYLIPDSKLFLYLYSASVFPGMVAWFVLAYAQKNFRKAWGPEVMAKHPFKSPLYPYSNYFCIIFLILVTIGMIYNPDTRMSIFSSWVYIAAVVIAWFACGLNKKQYDK